MTTSDSAARAMIPEPTRTGLAADALQRAVLDNLTCLQASLPAIATPNDWYMALAYSVRDRMLARWVSTVRTYAARDVKVVCYLSAEFLIGPQLGNNLVNLGIEAGRARGDARARPGPRRAARARRRAGPRQRRPRTAGGLLPGLARHARGAGDRLRHPLRVRHLRPGDPRRLAGGGDRQVAAEGQPLGDRAPGRQLLRQLRRPHRGLRPTPRAAIACAGSRRVRSRAWPATRRCSATASTPATRCGCGRARRSSPSTSRTSTSATTTARSSEKIDLRDPLQGALPERRAGDRQAPAPRAAVLLRLLLAAGHAAPARHRRTSRSRASPTCSPCS